MTTRLDDDLCARGPGRQLAGIAAVQLGTIQHCKTPLNTKQFSADKKGTLMKLRRYWILEMNRVRI